MKYVISDLHFNHPGIILMDRRPFNTVVEMNYSLISNWNKLILPKDEVYILGDLAFGNASRVEPIIKQLRGRKYFIRGNHDKFLDDPAFDSSLFEWIRDIGTFKVNHKRYQLCHYPILEYNGRFHNNRLLYGHIHGKRKDYFQRLLSPYAVNVSANMIGYKPASLEQLEQIITAQWQSKLLSIIDVFQYALPKSNGEMLKRYKSKSDCLDIEKCKRIIVKLVAMIIKEIDDKFLLKIVYDSVPIPELIQAIREDN